MAKQSKNNGIITQALKFISLRLKKLVSSYLGANVIEKPAIVRGVILSYLQMALGMILTFLLTPFTLHYLGATAFGLWATLGSVVGYFGLTDFGMTAAVLKYTAQYRAQDDHKTLNKVLSTILGAFIMIGCAIFFLSLLLVPLIPQIFHLSGDLTSTGQIAFLIMILNIALGLISGVFSFVIYGYQRVDIQRSIAIFSSLINAGLVVLFLKLGGGLIGVVLASSVSILGAIFFSWIYLHRSNWDLSFRPRLFDIKTLLDIAPYSLRCFILGVTNQVLFHTDNIVIGIILGMAIVTPYAIMYKLTYIAKSIVSQLSDTIQPTFTRLYTIGDHVGLKNLYLKTMRSSVGVMVLLTMFLLILGKSFIDLWVGEQNFAGMGVLVVLILIDLIFSLNPNYTLLQAIGKNQALMYSSLFNAGFNLLLSIYLAHKIGLIGIPLGTLIAHLCTDSWIVIWSACKEISLPVKTLFSTSILPPLLAGIPAAVISYYFHKNLMQNTYFHIGLIGGVLVTVYLFTIIIVWFFVNKVRNMHYAGNEV